MALAAVTLDDKYALETGRIFLTGAQALVRLPLMQRKRDEAAGLNTAGFISGYRGSPLGGFDQQLWKARKYLAESHIHFQPGVNEDLGATAVWGSQQVNLWPGGRYDGVFGIWYGKGPGVDRSGDVLRHANFAGTAPHGGVMALAGDDHACKSSTVPHQSEHAFVSAMIPVLNPANIQEILDLGLYGWAMSRFAGTWVGFKAIADTVDSSASVFVDPHRIDIALPDIDMPPGGLNIRWPDPPMVQEERLMRHKLYAALAFVRENRLDRVVWGAEDRRIGLVTTGKSYLDTRQALEELGITEDRARALGIAIYKVAMPWPLEPQGVRAFAEGLEELVVVEEKRALIENQLKEQLYNWHADSRPVIVGKFDEERNWILPSTGELTPSQIAVVIGHRLLRKIDDAGIADRVRFLEEKEASKVVRHPNAIDRPPWYCSGCPHNTSTVVPEGSRALAGIGCHYMAIWMNRSTETFSQMGGEGAAAIGQQPFRETEHVFANLGDGTYFHSGSLAVRAAVASGINITYKILYNDAVAMTGGQPVDGTLTVPMIANQMKAEGVRKVVVVSDQPEKYDNLSGLPHGTAVEHRDELDRIQKDLRETPGVTVLIYDQTCAAEKRRRRKRGLMEDPDRRIVINELVCEGCGDCSKQSNCLSVVPVDTEWGRKRAIDQSSCNKDYSCVKGFCPSFVDVIGGTPKKPKAAAGDGADDGFPALPDPALPALDRPFNLLITGIGGTGVVTIGALLGMAAHLEGKGCSVLDQAGLAQKGGAVMSHIRLAKAPEDLNAVRIPAGGAHLVLGCDLVVAAGAEARSAVKPGETRIVANGHETVTGAFTRNPGWQFPGREMVDILREAAGDDALVDVLDATLLATRLLGNSIATNLFMLGFAWQKGLIPVSAEALDQAIDLNGVSVAMNKAAFLWGRRAAHDREAVQQVVDQARGPTRDARRLSESLDEMIDRRQAFLADYQDAAYAGRYRSLVDRVREAEIRAVGAPPSDADGRTPKGALPLTEAVAQTLYRLMAIKDEYEVARLYTDGRFLKQLRDQFDGDVKLRFHLAPPLLAERDPETGHLKKQVYGPWMLKAFGMLAKLKRLRGTRWDIFGYSEERRTERRLIGDFETVVEDLLPKLTAENRDLAIEIAKVPGEIKGFGHVKEANLKVAKAREAELLATWHQPTPVREAAE